MPGIQHELQLMSAAAAVSVPRELKKLANAVAVAVAHKLQLLAAAVTAAVPRELQLLAAAATVSFAFYVRHRLLDSVQIANAAVSECCRKPHFDECTQGDDFKCGFASADGCIEVDFGPDAPRYTRRSETDMRRPYAHGLPLEVFNAPVLDYFEVETHSPLQTLGAGEVLRFGVVETLGG